MDINEVTENDIESEDTLSMVYELEEKLDSETKKEDVPLNDTTDDDNSFFGIKDEEEVKETKEETKDENKEGEGKDKEGEPILPLPQFKKEVRDNWDKMTPEAQKMVVDQFKATQATFTQQFQEMAPIRKTIEGWTPYVKAIAGDDYHPMEYANDLFKYDYRLNMAASKFANGDPSGNTEGLEILREIAEVLGFVAPDQVEEKTKQRKDFQNSPEYQAVLKNEQARLENEKRIAQQQTNNEIAGYTNQLLNWGQAKDEGGNAKYPFFRYVAETMADVAEMRIKQNIPVDMDDLYNTAIQLNPVVKNYLDQNKSQQQKSQKAANLSINGTGKPLRKAILEKADNLGSAEEIAAMLLEETD